VFRRLLSDRNALDDFFKETTALVEAITVGSGRDQALVRRQIHTVKGNSAVFGLESVAALCHQMENKMAEGANGGEPLSAADLEALKALWGRAVTMRAQFNEGGSGGTVELADHEYGALLEALRGRTAHDTLLASALTWRSEPVAKRLGVIDEQLRALASRLGKAPVEVVSEPTTLRLPAAKWSGFWSAFAHVVRNTADHGIETAARRAAAGKPPKALVTLAVRREGGSVVVSIGDDGPGIDWAAIAARAAERGLPHESRGDLEAALFSDGITARREASTTSGRGVGLSAMSEVIRQLNGRIEIESAEGRGTTFRFVLPDSMLVDDSTRGRAAENGASATLARN
jgi:two-component system chemotaxis sensor kinase CheA